MSRHRTRTTFRTIVVTASLGMAVGLLAQGPAPRKAGLPLPTFDTSHFSGSGNCATCHSGLVDSASRDVSIDTHWRSTMMANSSRDPLWQAKVSAEVARTPALKAVIEDKCATCHTPMARTQAVADASPVALLDMGFLDDAHPLHQAARDGVSCTLCHQIQNRDLGAPPSFTGHYLIDTGTARPAAPVFGPFTAPLLNPMRQSSGFTPTHSAHVRDSGLCATCHTLYTPTVDATGAIVGQLPEQTPYLEWRHSSYGDGVDEDRSCQQCHMPAAAGGVAIANRPWRWLTPRSPFSQHTFAGANAFMLGMLSTSIDELGLTASTDQFQATIQRTTDQLATGTARLSVEDARLDAGLLTVGLRVESLTGHKLPTGFPSRRAWVHLTVTGSNGRVVFESGTPLEDGSIAGNAADENPGAFEPHYDRITEPSQVQIYEAIMADPEGNVTYTLLRGARYAKDNRLLPAGFDPATAPADVAVYGCAAQDRDFSGGTDRLTYVIETHDAEGPLTVTARLLYQTVSSRFVRDLRETATPAVARYGALHDAADRTPALLASTRADVR